MFLLCREPCTSLGGRECEIVCEECQKIAKLMVNGDRAPACSSPSHPSYLPIEGAKSTWPFANCSMDMITDLPTSGGYNSILAVVDHGLMKGVIY